MSSAAPQTPMALTESNLHFRRLTPLEAAAYLIGTNVGAAIPTLTAMGLALLFLTVWSLRHHQSDFTRLAAFVPGAVWPVLPVAVFTCMSQAAVPEIVRGLAYEPRLIPRVICWSLPINLAFCLVVALTIFALVPAGHFAEVATVSWGGALGPWGLVTANLFAFFALLTSFWGTSHH